MDKTQGLPRWRPIPELPSYEASDAGQIRSVARIVNDSVGRKQPIKGMVLRVKKERTGYLAVSIRQTGKNRRFSVHRLVLYAFRGPPSVGMEARHLNGDRTDNRLVNLTWGTKRQNTEDKYKHKTIKRGENHGMSILTEANVEYIRKLVRDRLATYAELAQQFNASPATISHAANGTTWRHLKEPPVSKQPTRKLNAANILYIRARYTKGATSQKDLAKMFGISIDAISRIIQGSHGPVQQSEVFAATTINLRS